MSEPALIARYELINRIGQGGMGTLYLARDPAIERLVAIKLLKEGLESSELRERFTREARSAGRLRHPNIVTIFDVGEHEGRPFIAMEYIPGETLSELIRRGAPIPLVRKLEIVDSICQGLAYAHKSGIVHRDIKPANVMVDAEGVVKILDFGIARVDKSEVTRHGMVIGSLNYMSPEQMSGARIDHRTDLFALGAVFYELLSRRQAFPGGLNDGILHRVMTQDPAPLTTFIPDLDPEIMSCVMRTLKKDPDQRYQDVSTLRKDLERVRARAGVERDAAEPTVRIVLPEPPAAKPPRRPTDRELVVQQRAQRIQELIDMVGTALNAGDLKSARASCDEALMLDPDHEAALNLKERVGAAEEAALKKIDEARAHERRARAAVEAARRAFAIGDHAPALERLMAFAPPHELVTAAVAELRIEALGIQRRTQALTKLSDARAALKARRFTDALRALTEAREIDPAVPGLEELQTDVENRLAAAEEKERRQRVVAEKVTAASRLLAADDPEGALHVIAEALDVDPRSADAVRLKGEIDAAIRHRIEERAAEDRQNAERQRELDAERAEASRWAREQEEARQREAEIARERRAEARRALEEQAAADKARAQQALNEGRFETAIVALNAAKAATPADEQIDELIGAVRSAQAAAETDRRRRQTAEEKLAEARRLVSSGNLAEAARLIEAVLLLAPDHGDAAALGEHCRTELEAQRRDAEERQAAERAIAGARRLFRKGRGEEAIAQLEAFAPAVHVRAALDELRSEWHLKQRQKEAEAARERQRAEERTRLQEERGQDDSYLRRVLGQRKIAVSATAIVVAILAMVAFRAAFLRPDPGPTVSIEQIETSARNLADAGKPMEAAEEVERGLLAFPGEARLATLGQQIVKPVSARAATAADGARRAGTTDRPEFGNGARAETQAQDSMKRAKYAAALRGYLEAATHYEQALKFAPPVVQILELRRTGDDRGALDLLVSSLANNPRHAQLTTLLDQLKADADKHASDAATTVRLARGFDPRSPQFLEAEARRGRANAAPVTAEAIRELWAAAEAYRTSGRDMEAASLRALGLALTARGQRREALQQLADAERRFPGHRYTIMFGRELSEDASRTATSARQRASAAGATATNSASFREAELRETTARVANRTFEKARAWFDASDRFDAAAREPRPGDPPTTAGGTGLKNPSTLPPNAGRGSSSAGGPSPPSGGSDSAGGDAKSKTGTGAAKLPVDRDGIRAALEQYRAAYQKLDPDLLRTVFPSLPRDRARAMLDSKRACRSYDVVFVGEPKLTLSEDGSVLAETRTDYVCMAKTAKERQSFGPMYEGFTLRRNADGRWVILRTLREG